MPTQRELELERAKKRVEDRLKARPSEIESGIAKTRADLLAGDVSRQQETRDILTGVGARYGVLGTQEAGVSAIGERAPEFERQRTTALSFRRMQEMNNFFNQRYDYAQNQYLQAGYDLEQSRNFARQWALQQTQQAFEGEMAELGRQGALEKEKISQEFSEKGLALEEDFAGRYDPYQEAAIRGLIGIAPYVGYNEYLRRQGRRPPQRPYPPSGRLTEATTFTPREPGYYGIGSRFPAFGGGRYYNPPPPVRTTRRAGGTAGTFF